VLLHSFFFYLHQAKKQP